MQYAARTEQRVLLRVNALCVGGVGAADRLQYLRVGIDQAMAVGRTDWEPMACNPGYSGLLGVQEGLGRRWRDADSGHDEMGWNRTPGRDIGTIRTCWRLGTAG